MNSEWDGGVLSTNGWAHSLRESEDPRCAGFPEFTNMEWACMANGQPVGGESRGNITGPQRRELVSTLPTSEKYLKSNGGS